MESIREIKEKLQSAWTEEEASKDWQESVKSPLNEFLTSYSEDTRKGVVSLCEKAKKDFKKLHAERERIAVVLNAFQIKDTPEIRTGLLYSMGIAVGMHVVFLLLNALFRKALKLDAVEQVNIIYSNAAALVIPIVQALLGEKYVVYSCAFVIVQLVLLCKIPFLQM